MEKCFLSTDHSSIMVCQWLVIHFGQYIYPSKWQQQIPWFNNPIFVTTWHLCHGPMHALSLCHNITCMHVQDNSCLTLGGLCLNSFPLEFHFCSTNLKHCKTFRSTKMGVPKCNDSCVNRILYLTHIFMVCHVWSCNCCWHIIDILSLLLAFYKTIYMCQIKIVIYMRPFIWELA